MILNYKFGNVLSFKDDAEFSMMAPKTKVKKRFPNNYTAVGPDGTEVLKTAVIVGENAGGKSNFVTSLRYLQTFFKENKTVKSYRNMINTNNYQDLCPVHNDTCQSFGIEIWIRDEGYFRYELELDYLGIVGEKLEVRQKYDDKYKVILEAARTKEELDCQNGDRECDQKEGCCFAANTEYKVRVPLLDQNMQKALRESTKQGPVSLFVTKTAILGIRPAMLFSKWMTDNLFPESISVNYDLYKSRRNDEDDLRIINDARFLDIFKMVDYSIVGIRADEDKPFTKTTVLRRGKAGNIFARELERDSSGVRAFFSWAVQLFRIVYENKVVFADEMDGVLNPVLSDRIIAFVNGHPHYGQFICTTHNVLHLNLKKYMKEQIYFITKDTETLESELYSLADFPDIRYETAKIYEIYMKGILGGTASEQTKEGAAEEI